jgi:SSS family solute:Na+ symporter
MQTIDWIFLAVPLLFVIAVGIYTHRYLKSVADFLSGGRLAGRYLLAVARGEMSAGAVMFVAGFEVLGKAGFTMTWWSWLTVPVGLLISVSGFVIYRYRETRALTLAQFFEVRYNKSFRVFTGFLGFGAGIVNFGIIPAIGARFFVYFLELPQSLHCFSMEIPTYIPVMAFLLTISLSLTLSGGVITMIVTDCVEGIISQIFYLAIVCGLLLMFDWSQIADVLVNRPAGQSMVNPFDSKGLQDFNIWYVFMSMFVGIYGTMAWQNQSSFNAASLTPHESRMGGVLGKWREIGKHGVSVLLAICALTFLTHPDFAGRSTEAHAQIAAIGDPHTQQQMSIPVALAHLLPPGLKGALCVIIFMGVFCGDGLHLHSWGGLFIQDVLVPLRKKPLLPQQHIRWLRFSLTGVAVFAFLFGCLCRQTEYIIMWWQVTMGIYISGAGAAIIGGLYWKKGTAAGAWTAVVTGSTLSVAGILARQVYGNTFPLNGMQIFFLTSLVSTVLYVAVSLLTNREDFNMDRMLHRGRYAQKPEGAPAPVAKPAWKKMVGYDDDFSKGDKVIVGGLFAWGMMWFVVFAVGSVWNLIAPWPVSVWLSFWHVVAVGLPVFILAVTSVWFTWGGLLDLRSLFQRLKTEKVNILDNGMVVNHQNLSEVAETSATKDRSRSEPKNTVK